MKAIQVDTHGGPEVLRLQDVQVSQPSPGQARIQVKAAGLNFVDIYIRRGDYRTMTPPFIPGFEGAGIREGWLKLRIDHVLPLAEAARAHYLLEDRQSIGKIVLKT